MLVVEMAVFEGVTKGSFETPEGRFDQAAAVVTHVPLPGSPAEAADLTEALIARQPRRGTVAVLADARVLAQRNDRLDLLLSEKGVHLPVIVTAVAQKFFDALRDLVEQRPDLAGISSVVGRQHVRCNLLRLSINGQMNIDWMNN